MKDIGVVYLCRHHEGDIPVLRFLDSYKAFPAGAPHDLHVVFKGFPDSNELDKTQALFSGLSINSLEVDDDRYDIDAYLFAANTVRNRRLLFLNTFSEILAPNWLSYFDAALNNPTVGLVGATGSWQSAPSSYERALNKLLLIVSNLGATLKSSIRRAFDRPDEERSETPSGNKAATMTAAELEQLRRPAWRYLIAPFLYLRALYEYPRFPDAHIRTNAFFIDRQTFLSLHLPKHPTKSEMYKFESGRCSMTRQILALGLQPVVVDRRGNVYHITEWRSSSTFWTNDQINLLVSDNRSRAYADGTAAFRQALETSAWIHPWHAD